MSKKEKKIQQTAKMVKKRFNSAITSSKLKSGEKARIKKKHFKDLETSEQSVPASFPFSNNEQPQAKEPMPNATVSSISLCLKEISSDIHSEEIVRNGTHCSEIMPHMTGNNQISLWNDINLPAPNGDFCSYDTADFGIIGNVSKLISDLSNAATQISSDHPAWLESKFFVTLLERMALKLPCDKFLHILKMVGHCVRNLVSMKLFERYLDLAERFLQRIQNATQVICLPSKQQLEYLLIKTQGAAKLILKTISYVEEAFVYLIQRLKIGHLVSFLTMACATLGRIRTTYMALLLQICEIFKQIKPWQNCLKAGTWQWPCDPNLPENLWKWLNVDEFEKNSMANIERSEEVMPFLHSFFTSKTNQKITDYRENETTAVEEVKSKDVETYPGLKRTDDMGEVQPRSILPEFDTTRTSSSLSEHLNDSDDEETPLLKMAKETKSVKEMLFILKMLCSNRQKFIEEMVRQKIPKNSYKKVKRLFRNLKSSFTLSKNENNKKMIRKELLKTAKAKLDIILKQQRQEDEEKLLKNNIHISPATSKNQPRPMNSPKLIPVDTLIKLQKLFDFIKSKITPDLDEQHAITRIFKRGKKNARLLKKFGDSDLAKKLVLRTSKKIIRLYKTKFR